MSETLRDRLGAQRVQLLSKRDSRSMRVLGALLRPLGNDQFMQRYWTTIGRRVYYPLAVQDPWAHPDVLEHELVHVQQWERLGVLFWIAYLLLPLPVGLAFGRFYFEREAYRVQLARLPARERPREIERIVDALWHGYGYPWPRRWMRRWFQETFPPPGK